MKNKILYTPCELNFATEPDKKKQKTEEGKEEKVDLNMDEI